MGGWKSIFLTIVGVVNNGYKMHKRGSFLLYCLNPNNPFELML